jgi:REP element-mobilizing transposase RayT
MPRTARLRGPECTYHIIVRSISEVYLFNDNDDKERYLKTLKKYQDLFFFKLYAYCIMGSHAHFIIYSNGADISKIMHGVNQSYAQYYNLKHGRHGHLFQDRFKSKIIKDEGYLVGLSGYIHNNPQHMKNYAGRVEDYPYSSLGIYLGLRKDKWDMVDPSMVLNLFSKNVIYARREYMKFIPSCTDIDKLPEIEFENETADYWSQKSLIVRGFNPESIAEHISSRMGFDKITLSSKHCRNATVGRSLFAVFLRCYCDYKCRDICNFLGNITQARVSALCSKGIKLIQGDERYRNMMYGLIDRFKAV